MWDSHISVYVGYYHVLRNNRDSLRNDFDNYLQFHHSNFTPICVGQPIPQSREQATQVILHVNMIVFKRAFVFCTSDDLGKYFVPN